LLNFAKHREPKIEPVSIKHLVNNAIKLIGSTMGGKREVKIDYASENYYVSVDIQLVQQALVNVITALNDFMNGSGAIKIQVTSTFKHDTLLPFRDEDLFGDYVKLVVTDEDNFDHYRDKPLTIDATRNRKMVSGLGVAIVSGIVKDFNGMFYLHGDSQKPTGFTICFPQVVDAPAVEEVAPVKQPAVVAKAKILVLDNEAIFIQMVKDLMDLLGYEVAFCTDGQDCLNSFVSRAAEFNLLMLDYGEKDLLPVEVMDAFKEKNPNIKILLTSSRQVEEVSMIADLQKCEFIEKPFKMKDFSRLLSDMLEPSN
jgi:CheY-like chemotaxis protein